VTVADTLNSSIKVVSHAGVAEGMAGDWSNKLRQSGLSQTVGHV